jgi:hypothetical protein
MQGKTTESVVAGRRSAATAADCQRDFAGSCGTKAVRRPIREESIHTIIRQWPRPQEAQSMHQFIIRWLGSIAQQVAAVAPPDQRTVWRFTSKRTTILILCAICFHFEGGQLKL